MPRQTLVKTRKGGYCDLEFAHDGRIEVGDVILVETVYPRSELTHMGVAPWTRFRTCKWCLERKFSERYHRDRMTDAFKARWYELTGNDPVEDAS